MGASAYPNFNSFEIVQVGITGISASASFGNWQTIAHNLGYAPVPQAILNNVGVTFGATTVFSHGNIPLPTPLGSSLVSGAVAMNSYLYIAADSLNTYIVLENATGSPISSFPVKYWLLREKAN